jgi:arsenate reductase (glutaredoxin)
MKINNNEIFVFYNPESDLGKKTIAYAKSICNHVNDVPCDKNEMTGALWKEMLYMLGMNAIDIVDQNHPVYEQKLVNSDISEDDWLTILKHEPGLLRAPIAIKGRRAVLCNNANDVLKLKFSEKPKDESESMNEE